MALLIAGHGPDGYKLYHADPSGSFGEYYAKCIGAGAEIAQLSLQEQYKKVTCDSYDVGNDSKGC